MKPHRSTKRQWLLAARVTRWAAFVLLAGGLAALGLSMVHDATSREGGASSWSSSAARTAPAAASPSTRPALVQAIASRSIRHRLIPEPAPATQPAAAPTAVVEAPPASPPFEVVATFMAPEGNRTAYARRADRPGLLTWTATSTEGPFAVTEIGDGWVTLQADDVRHTLRVPRRGSQ